MTLLWIVNELHFSTSYPFILNFLHEAPQIRRSSSTKRSSQFSLKWLFGLKQSEIDYLLLTKQVSVKHLVTRKIHLEHVIFQFVVFNEVRSSRVNKSRYKVELCKMASHFELLTQTFLYKFFFRVTNSLNFVDY